MSLISCVLNADSGRYTDTPMHLLAISPTHQWVTARLHNDSGQVVHTHMLLSSDRCVLCLVCVGWRNVTAGHTSTQNALVGLSVHTATADTTRLSRLPVDCRDAGQAATPSRLSAHTKDAPHAATLYAAQNANALWTVAYD